MTIKDLSAMTGYSVGTVSRVLNDRPNVSEKARAVILEAARSCGFQLNTNAQQLKQQRSNTILMIVKGSSNQLFGRLVEIIQSMLADSPYRVTVDYMDEDQNEVLRALRLYRERKPLGILFLGGNREHFLADFSKIDAPSVLVTSDGTGLPFPNLSSVCSDEVSAVRQTIHELIRLGHRRIAVIGGRRDKSDTTRRRFDGCLAAFQEENIYFDPSKDYESSRFSYEAGYQATAALIEKNREYTAIFCMADVIAMGAIRALTDHGLRVPEDVSVVGFDGLSIGAYMVPRLATVSQDIQQIAQQSMDILYQGIAGKMVSVHGSVPTQLQMRESARAI